MLVVVESLNGTLEYDYKSCLRAGSSGLFLQWDLVTESDYKSCVQAGSSGLPQWNLGKSRINLSGATLMNVGIPIRLAFDGDCCAFVLYKAQVWSELQPGRQAQQLKFTDRAIEVNVWLLRLCCGLHSTVPYDRHAISRAWHWRL